MLALKHFMVAAAFIISAPAAAELPYPYTDLSNHDKYVAIRNNPAPYIEHFGSVDWLYERLAEGYAKREDQLSRIREMRHLISEMGINKDTTIEEIEAKLDDATRWLFPNSELRDTYNELKELHIKDHQGGVFSVNYPNGTAARHVSDLRDELDLEIYRDENDVMADSSWGGVQEWALDENGQPTIPVVVMLDENGEFTTVKRDICEKYFSVTERRYLKLPEHYYASDPSYNNWVYYFRGQRVVLPHGDKPMASNCRAN